MSQVCLPPAPETVTTHAARCPEPACLRETRVGLGADSGVAYGSCSHFREAHQIGQIVRIVFEVQP